MVTPQQASGMIRDGDLGGKSQSPLFTDEQLRKFQDIYQSAPLLYPRMPESLKRPEWMEMEERHQRREEEYRRWQKEMEEQEMVKDYEMQKLKERALALERENTMLRLREMTAYERSSRCGTPEGESEGTGPKETAQVPRMQAAPEVGKRPAGVKEDGRGKGRPEAADQKDPEGMKGVLEGMMKLMQGMQVMQSQILEVRRNSELEVVKSGVSDLPKHPGVEAGHGAVGPHGLVSIHRAGDGRLVEWISAVGGTACSKPPGNGIQLTWRRAP